MSGSLKSDGEAGWEGRQGRRAQPDSKPAPRQTKRHREFRGGSGTPRGPPAPSLSGLGGCPAPLPAAEGELFPRGALQVSGRSRALSTAGCPGGGGALGAAGAPVCFGLVCLFVVWPPLYVDQAGSGFN